LVGAENHGQGKKRKATLTGKAKKKKGGQIKLLVNLGQVTGGKQEGKKKKKTQKSRASGTGLGVLLPTDVTINKRKSENRYS